ncbi:SMAD/FHA domain-containing protein, partial [Dichotomocladium elegans]
RRSLHLSQGLLGRRFSRTLNRGHSSSEPTSIPPASSEISLHVRIVPSIDNPRRSLIFDVIDREIKVGTVVKIGRFTDRTYAGNHISFKSKVVSRTHCEIWVDADSKLYIRDTKSSSGTFLNHVRLGLANQESPPAEIHDGDIIQLGVDYQGGLEEMYRSVKMRFELNSGQGRPATYNMAAFQQLRNITSGGKSPPLPLSSPDSLALPDQQQLDTHHVSIPQQLPEVDECCICLYALAPVQALFVAPCSHCYHFKCIRPLLESYPGFQCPICRGYSDLEASVAIEPEEV